MNETLYLAKRLADYCRMTIEIGELKSDSPIGIAYRDFIEEWNKYHLTSRSSRAAGTCICKDGGLFDFGNSNICINCGGTYPPPV